MNIEKVLTDGSPRALGRTDEVVAYILANQTKLEELFACVFNEDEIVRMRAGDALEKICRAKPDWLNPYIDRLLNDVAMIDQPSIQWHVAQMIGELNLNADQYKKAVSILKNNLETATDWIVLNYSLEVFGKLVSKDPDLKPYFTQQLQKHKHNQHKSVAKRANKLQSSL